MWATIIAAVLRIIIWIIDLVGADEKTKKKLEEFIKAASNDKKSAALMKAGQKQLEWLKNNKKIVNPVFKPNDN